MRRTDFGDLTQNVTEFGRLLRARGVLCGPREVLDALRALRVVDFYDPDLFRYTLRTTLSHRVEDLKIFDAAYGAYWAPPAPAPERTDEDGGERPQETEGDAPAEADVAVQQWTNAEQQPEGEQEVPGYSEQEALSNKDFSTFQDEDLDRIAALVVEIAKRIATRLSRSMRRAKRSHRIDMRRTMRLHLRWGGDLPELAFRKRRIRKTRVVLLCDVSGSMDVYSRFLIQFVYALQDAIGRVESFVFSTSLTRVTPALRTRTLRAALDRLARTVPNWSGGTKIGRSFRDFVDHHAHLLDPHTVVIVVSDGWDTGEAEVLSEAMREIQERVARVVWLNPLLGSPGYQPLTRGMQAALPYIDVFASAHNLDSLKDLEKVLVAQAAKLARGGRR
ncbi:MAG: VWA domain-containing protein [Armatimonadetes bacterium]|nr:VWA domain-containing protein [Armatimonadota bacterium]